MQNVFFLQEAHSFDLNNKQRVDALLLLRYFKKQETAEF